MASLDSPTPHSQATPHNHYLRMLPNTQEILARVDMFYAEFNTTSLPPHVPGSLG